MSHSQALSRTNIQENKLHLIKSRFKQMCLKTSCKSADGFTISDRSWQSIPQSLGSNTKCMIPKAFESAPRKLRTEWRLWNTIFEH